jgi:hypothetical protein
MRGPAKIYVSSAADRFEAPEGACGNLRRSFKPAALAVSYLEPNRSTKPAIAGPVDGAWEKAKKNPDLTVRVLAIL